MRTYSKAPVESHHQLVFENIGLTLRQYRVDSGITRKEMDQHGFSRSLVDRIESGKIITIHSLLRYMDYLQIEYSALGIFMTL